jgi:hypothetical protein
MANDNALFKVDSITVDGVGMAIEDGSATVEGIAGFTTESVPSASGDDGVRRRRVPRVINARIQFKPGVSVDSIKGINNAQIVLKDTFGPRRLVCNKCCYGSMGTVGDGPVAVTFNVLAEPQWL